MEGLTSWGRGRSFIKPAQLKRERAGTTGGTTAMVQARAEELAVIKGRRASDVTQSDLTQARRELTGTPDAKA